MNKIRIGIVQVSSGPSIHLNTRRVLRYIREATQKNCKIIVLPEYCFFRGHVNEYRKNWYYYKRTIEPVLFNIAKENNILLVAGTIQRPKRNKYYNSLYIYNSNIKLKYDKQHLFKLKKDNIIIREDFTYIPGTGYTIAEYSSLSIGFGICFDLRYPEFFRYYFRRRTDIIIIPSDFTQETGKAHWEVLLRARAIENQCFIIAANQTGKNLYNDIFSYGHSMIISPWGDVILSFGKDTGLKIADINIEEVKRVREVIEL